ncbi:hypothetical protein ACFQPA_06170 [Halomarina halobia]|uniref:XapX domain-containing protein n=1 Tax=Halomarina halobia TaxID=3033386 RepID=A0ABD6A5Y1_9EURY|nr:hypothetical protein [Halomarina sp. PSR21]
MNRMRMVGLALTALALCGYVLGVVAPYPGRSITVTGVMVGIALAAMSDPRQSSSRTREPSRDPRRFDGGGSTDGRDAPGSPSTFDGADVRAGTGGDRA